MNYVQYGCGWDAPEGWINFDASPALLFERTPIIGRLYTKNASRFPENVRYGDIVRGLPISPGSCAGIYCSHVLEHLSLEDFDIALSNTFRYLAPRGIFRLVVPDLRQIASEYLSANSDDAALLFMQHSGLGIAERRRGVNGLLRLWLGNSAHLWMWDERSISKHLALHGFSSIRRAVYGDSSDDKFRAVEKKQRFEKAVAIECRRPG